MKNIELDQTTKEILRVLNDAKKSVWLRFNAHKPVISNLPQPHLPFILRTISPKVDSRIIIGVLESEGEFYPPLIEKVMNIQEITSAIQTGSLRLSWEWDGWEGIIIDESEALVMRSYWDTKKDGKHFKKEEVYLITDSSEVAEYVEHYKQDWIYKDVITLLKFLKGDDRKTISEIYTFSEEHWSHIIKSLANNPTQLYNLHPREFEELVAELLDRQGMEIKLTPRTRDGGRDILAWNSTPIGKFLYLVECKRYAPQRPVGVGIVRELYGVVESEKASGGIVITTSRFTEDAWGFSGKCGTRMSLRDYDIIIDWLKRG